MQQSYKVFIENGSIEVRNYKIRESENVLDAKLIDPDMENNNLLLLAQNEHVAIKASKVDATFKSLFKGYKKIAAAGGIVQCGYEYLVIKRNGIWDLPKGKVEENEEIEIAAVREVEEECGISRPRILEKLSKTYHSYVHKNKNVLKTTHWYYMKYDGSEKLIPQTDEGIEEVKWVRFEELIEMKKTTYSSLVQVIEGMEKIVERRKNTEL
jgi:8-oxo-dGTP pyrophosphatase MutT (NUDIX family)